MAKRQGPYYVQFLQGDGSYLPLCSAKHQAKVLFFATVAAAERRAKAQPGSVAFIICAVEVEPPDTCMCGPVINPFVHGHHPACPLFAGAKA